MRLTALSLAFALGIFLGSKIDLSFIIISVAPIVLSLLFFGRHHKKALLSSLCLVALVLGSLRLEGSKGGVGGSYIQFYNDMGTVSVRGIVARDPEMSGRTVHLYLSATELRFGGKGRKVSGNLFVFAPLYSDYRYGDELELTGELKTPPAFTDFDYRGYLENQAVYATMLYPDIEILERGRGFILLEWIYALRKSMSYSLARVLPEPQAALSQGIVLGLRSNIPDSVREDFVRSGTMHLLAISGANLSIVALMLVSLALWLWGRRHNIHILFSLAIIWLYALLTGFAPSVVRSAIMTSFFLAAELFGRQRSALTALTFSAAIMIAVSPKVLRDASFQMSFLATAGLILLFPLLGRLGREGINALLGIKGLAPSITSTVTDSLMVSLSATIALMPLLISYFGRVSLMTLPATVLALPALPALIATGLLTGISGILIPPLAYILGWVSSPFLSYVLLVAELFASLSFSVVEAPKIDSYLILAYYLVLALALWLSRHFWTLANDPQDSRRLSLDRFTGLISGRSRKWLAAPLLLIVILSGAAALFTRPDDNLHVSFLDVGQGDAILIRRGSIQILVDGGPSPQQIALELSGKMPFWDRDIELVVLTHPDSDHLIGLFEVLKRYDVKQMLYANAGSTTDVYEKWQAVLKERNIPYRVAEEGQNISLDDVSVQVLSPKVSRLDSADVKSVVLRISKGGVGFLLTADIKAEEELELVMVRANLKSTVLKVAHHGSAHSSCGEFLAVVDPVVAVISVGDDNEYGHPADETIERLEIKVGAGNIYRTDLHGTVEFITDGERLWVRKGS